MAILIPHFGKLTEKQASDLIQRMMEFSSIHARLQSCRQDAYAEFMANNIPTDREKAIFEFFSGNAKETCGILLDFMVSQCLRYVGIADEQRTLGMTGRNNPKT